MKTKSLIISIIIILVVVIIGWYVYSSLIQQSQQDYSAELESSYSSDTTTNISNDLDQVPDDSSINGDLDSLDKDLESF